MTKPRLRAVGFCAWAGDAGDRAFQFALDLARRHGVRLDIFIFPVSPGHAHEPRGHSGRQFEMSGRDAVEIEKQVRLYYDEMLGDYLEAGYRLCLGDEEPELRRCLFDRQYDILVLPYESEGCRFGETRIEEFAQRMQCPVVRVGPVGGTEIHINHPAHLWQEELGIENQAWTPLPGLIGPAVG